MTTYEAYDKGLPCKNPNCKSHGKPHPNCKCYGDMAEGGEVAPYCDSGGTHRRECKYFKDGGEIHALDVPHHEYPGAAVSSYLSHQGMHGLLKMEGTSPQEDIDHYNHSIKRGHKNFDARVEALFSGGKIETPDHSKNVEHLEKWISRGGITDDIQKEIYNLHAVASYAKGGDVKNSGRGIHHKHHVAIAYPEHNVMLQEAKGRASDYLNALKPQKDQPRLAFDDAIEDPEKVKSYKKALHVAAHPLGVLDEVHKGTIDPEHVAHFNSMYPEVRDELHKRVTKRIAESQLENKKPSFKVRQGLSLLMGVPLSGELTPQNIMAAQETFQKQAPPSQSQGSGSKTKALEKVDDSYLTANQAAASRQQKQ